MSFEKLRSAIFCVLNETNITAYDPEVVISLCDFIYNYTASVLKEAQNCASDPKNLTQEDITMACKFMDERSVFNEFDEILEIAKNVNKGPLPEFSGRYGMKLPGERYCLNKSNYSLRRAGLKQNLLNEAHN